MRSATGPALLFATILLSGCSDIGGGKSPPASVQAGPHGGTAQRLPGDRGFLEIVNEPEASNPRSPAPTALVLYFLDAEGKAASSTPPSNVTVRVDRGMRSEKVEVKSEPHSGDPAGAARFASKTGPYGLAGIRGTVTAMIGGEQVTTDFVGGR